MKTLLTAKHNASVHRISRQKHTHTVKPALVQLKTLFALVSVKIDQCKDTTGINFALCSKHACVCKRGDLRGKESAHNRVGFASATVQTESTADGDAAVFIPHIQPQLTSAPS